MERVTDDRLGGARARPRCAVIVDHLEHTLAMSTASGSHTSPSPSPSVTRMVARWIWRRTDYYER